MEQIYLMYLCEGAGALAKRKTVNGHQIKEVLERHGRPWPEGTRHVVTVVVVKEENNKQ